MFLSSEETQIIKISYMISTIGNKLSGNRKNWCNTDGSQDLVSLVHYLLLFP